MLESLRIAKYRLTLDAVEELHLPAYKGSTLRGGFGHVFKRTVCFQKDVQSYEACLAKNLDMQYMKARQDERGEPDRSAPPEPVKIDTTFIPSGAP